MKKNSIEKLIENLSVAFNHQDLPKQIRFDIIRAIGELEPKKSKTAQMIFNWFAENYPAETEAVRADLKENSPRCLRVAALLDTLPEREKMPYDSAFELARRLSAIVKHPRVPENLRWDIVCRLGDMHSCSPLADASKDDEPDHIENILLAYGGNMRAVSAKEHTRETIRFTRQMSPTDKESFGVLSDSTLSFMEADFDFESDAGRELVARWKTATPAVRNAYMFYWHKVTELIDDEPPQLMPLSDAEPNKDAFGLGYGERGSGEGQTKNYL